MRELSRRQLRPLSPRALTLIGAILCFPWTMTLMATATPTVHSLFSDHMVLQRAQPIGVWGTGEPGTILRVALGKQEAAATVGSDGSWKATLGAMPAGGPHVMTVMPEGDDTALAIRFTDVWIGDVWLCSGQSNMQLPTRDVARADEEIAWAARYPGIRLYLVPKAPAKDPLREVKADWRVCAPESIADFSAVAYFFGRDLRESPELRDVPIGLIDSSFGGTVVEAWMSSETLTTKFAGEELHDSMFGFKPSCMYNGMIAPLIPFPLAGVVWYQGESNCPWPDQYRRLFTGLIQEWRAEWKRDDLPFLFVQLPNYAEKFCGAHFTGVREAQARVASEVPRAAMAVTLDTSDGFDLHPKEKREVARRLSLLARKIVYDEEVMVSGPVPRSARLEGARARILFSSVGSGLAIKCGETLTGFAVAGEDGFFRNADAVIDGPTVLVSHPAIPRPWYVRYAWSGNPVATLYNVEGLPAGPFRTDALPLSDLEIESRPAPRVVSQPSYEITVGGDACVDRLSVFGREFLAPPEGGIRGAAFYTFWGPVRMFTLHEEGPTVLAAEGDGAGVEYHFEAERMEWIVSNRSKENLPFRIHLSRDASPETKGAGADADADNAGAIVPGAAFSDECASATLVIGKSALGLSGIDKLSRRSPNEPAIAETLLKPGERRTILLIPRRK